MSRNSSEEPSHEHRRYLQSSSRCRSAGHSIVLQGIQSTFHSLVAISSSLLTRSSIDQIASVKKMFIHLHQTWEEWSNTGGLLSSAEGQDGAELTEQVRINGHEDGLTVREEEIRQLRSLFPMISLRLSNKS